MSSWSSCNRLNAHNNTQNLKQRNTGTLMEINSAGSWFSQYSSQAKDQVIGSTSQSPWLNGKNMPL